MVIVTVYTEINGKLVELFISREIDRPRARLAMEELLDAGFVVGYELAGCMPALMYPETQAWRSRSIPS